MLQPLLLITPSFTLFSIILLHATTTLSSANPQRPLPPPEVCYRRNDTLTACPYGGKCFPNRGSVCVTACVNYQNLDNRFWCNVDCAYKATSLSGQIAENPLVCVQATARNAFKCKSGWACYRRFNARPPLYRTQGPVCSHEHEECSQIGVEGALQASNITVQSSNSTETECSSGTICISDPRLRLARPSVPGPAGICVSMAKKCSGKSWNECGETEECAVDPRCEGKLGNECEGLCVKILGPTWGSYNSTISRRDIRYGRC